MPEWPTVHFEPSVATEKVCRDRVPWALYHDKVFRVATGLSGKAHDPACVRATGMHSWLGHALDIDTWLRVAIELLCRDRVWGWDWVTRVAIKVSLSRQSPFSLVLRPWTVSR